MKRKFTLLLFSFLIFLTLGSLKVSACICGKSSTCEKYNFADAVFIGKAVNVEKEQGVSLHTETTVFDVQEMFSGESKKQIKIINKTGFSCDVSFKKDEIFLVFAAQGDDGLFRTNFCAGNLPIQIAGEEIENLRKILKSDSKSYLRGVVLGEINFPADRDNRTPIQNLEVKIKNQNTGKEELTFTNEEGRYNVTVEAGDYQIIPRLPENLKFRFSNESETVRVKPRGCAGSYFLLANNSKISGKVLDVNGKPLENVTIELLSVTEKEKSFLRGDRTTSDEIGYFEFTEVPVGKFTLSVNYNSPPEPDSPYPTIFYPSSPNRENVKFFEVNLGSNIENIEFRLPSELKEKQFSGTVFWKDGLPAENVEITLEDDEFRGFNTGCFFRSVREKIENSDVVKATIYLTGLACEAKTDLQGHFNLSGFSNRKYRVKAEIEKIVNGQKIKYKAVSEAFSTNDFSSPLKLVLSEVK